MDCLWRAICWQPTGPMRPVERPLGLHVTCCMLGTYRSYEACWTAFGAQPRCHYRSYEYDACWTAFGAVCWQPTGCMLRPLRLYIGLCWQPTGPMKPVGRPLGLYVGNLEAVCWEPTGPMRPVGRLWGCMLVNQAVCWQPTGPMRTVGPPLGLYVGNVHIITGSMRPVDRLCGCMLASYRLYAGNLEVL